MWGRTTEEIVAPALPPLIASATSLPAMWVALRPWPESLGIEDVGCCLGRPIWAAGWRLCLLMPPTGNSMAVPASSGKTRSSLGSINALMSWGSRPE